MNSLNPIYCLNCKAALEDTAVVCPTCGRDQRHSANVADASFDQASRDSRGSQLSSSPPTVATIATIFGTALIFPIIVVCVWKHPLVCLLAIPAGVLPPLAFFHKQFRRNPVIPAAIACCLCLFCNQVLDRIQETRIEARAERLAARDAAVDTIPTLGPSQWANGAPAMTAPPARETAPAMDARPGPRVRSRRFPRGQFAWIIRRRMNRQPGERSFRTHRPTAGDGSTDALRRDPSAQRQNVNEGADARDD